MKPRVILYNAVSLDGRFDWFTPDIGLFYSLVPKWAEDATMVGTNTLLNPLTEIPNETTADLEPVPVDPKDTRPILVVPDSRGRFRNWHFMKQQPYWKGFVALCTETTPDDYLSYLQKRNIDCLVLGKDHVDFGQALEVLNVRFGIKVVRVDSGGTLNGVLFRLGLADEVHLLVHPKLVGGATPKSFFQASDLASPDGVIGLRLKGVEKQPGDILLLSYDVVR
jgi:2,5-diamino-6-(ribosylamino)-4(3H)-pyrimidinone 5'-phosphate reductase